MANLGIYISLLLITAIWGGSFSAIKHLLEVFTPGELILARFLPAAIIFCISTFAIYPKETLRILKEDPFMVILIGLIGTPGYHLALNYGETTISAGLASLIVGLNPSLTFIVSTLLIKEKPRPAKILGLAISFLGLFLLIRYGSGEELSYKYILGAIITILSPLCWAFYTTLSKPVTAKHPPFVVAAVTTTIGVIPTLFLLNGETIGKALTMRPVHIYSLFYLSLFATVIGNVVWMIGVKKITATRVSSFVYLVPFFAVIIGIIFLHEPINAMIIASGALIMGGVWVTNRKF